MEFYGNNQNARLNNEFYKVYDKNGKFLRIIDREDEKSLTEEYLHGVTCFVVRKNDETGKWEVLMEIRANTELTPGKKDLVSGHIDGNETPTQAVIRELGEEVGIKNVDASQVVKLTDLAKPLGFASRGKIRRFFIDFYCIVTKKHHFTIQPEEVKSLQWVEMEKVFDWMRNGETKFPGECRTVDYTNVFEGVKKAIKDREKGLDKKEL